MFPSFGHMKIYTRKGDDGTTGLLGGARVPKHHLRIEAYGTTDELNSHLGMLRDLTQDEASVAVILRVQDRIFTLGSHLATEPAHAGKLKLPEITGEDITALESEMDRLDESLPPMRNFILPGGHPAVSQCHIARCVCRRAERLVVALNEIEPVDPLILRYLNRLSDYLFVLSRHLSHTFGADEKPWRPS
jgi:cob(I)alamin adenosyltransferase